MAEVRKNYGDFFLKVNTYSLRDSELLFLTSDLRLSGESGYRFNCFGSRGFVGKAMNFSFIVQESLEFNSELNCHIVRVVELLTYHGARVE